jgi:glyoxylase-like metal-dependent hydrolase (beta-lactamase superfamily II)
MTGALTLWASPRLRAAQQPQQPSAAAGVKKVTDRVSVIDAGTNVVVLSGGDGLLIVDTGAPKSGDKLTAALKSIAANAKVDTVFNTHYHVDQTGNNELFSMAGAKIIAHARTQQWMANEYWIPEELRYEKARPKGAWPTQTFFNKDSMKVGSEQIDYGYLLDAHTGGDAYVYFKDSNVLAVGDVASPVKDPELDWITGAWIGARVTAMVSLL